MREIKFRGRDVLRDWYYGVVSADGLHIVKTHHGSDGQALEVYQSVEPATIGQYTGLKDRHGKEIYEGDIVEITSYYTHPPEKVFAKIRARVTFKKGAFIAQRNSSNYCIANFLENVEVLGNFHDNPELLNKQQ